MQDLATFDIKLKAKEDGRSTFNINSGGGNSNGYMFLLKPSTSQESQNYDIVQRGSVQNSTLTEKRAALVKSGKLTFLLIESDAPDVPDKPDEPLTPVPPNTGNSPVYPPDMTITSPSLPEIFLIAR